MLTKVLAQMVKNCMDTKLAGVTVQTGETYYVIFSHKYCEYANGFRNFLLRVYSPPSNSNIEAQIGLIVITSMPCAATKCAQFSFSLIQETVNSNI